VHLTSNKVAGRKTWSVRRRFTAQAPGVPVNPSSHLILWAVGALAVAAIASVWATRSLSPAAQRAGQELAKTAPGSESPHAPDPQRQEAHASAPVAVPSEAKPTLAEAARVSRWAHDRGYSLTVSIGKDGSLRTSAAFSGYEDAPEDQLEALAKSGDARASLILANRIRNRYGENALPPEAEKAEATRHYLDATMRGYTASIEQLVLMKQTEAAGAGTEARPGQSPLNRQALLEGYAYAYLLEMRGDLTGGSYVELLSTTGRLDAKQEASARAAAAELHAKMNARRSQLGLPFFQDGVPQEVRTLISLAERRRG